MPELTDLEILNLDDGPSPEVSSASPETSSESTPEETPTAETTPATAPATPTPEMADDYSWAKPLLQNPQYATKFKAAKERLETYQKTFGSVAGARAFQQQVHALGGVEQLKSIKGRVDQLDAVDKVFYGHDPEAKHQYLTNLRGQDPQAFLNTVANGLAILKSNPETYNYIVGPFIAEKLREDGLWHWLEYLHEAATKSGAEEVATLLNQFAGIFAKHGLGPGRESETGEVAQHRSAFNAQVGRMAGEELDADIVRAINHFAPQVSSDQQLQATIIDAVHQELQAAPQTDKHLRHALMNLSRAGISRSAGIKTANLLVSKLRHYIPSAINRVLKEFLPPQEPAPVKASTKTKKNVPERVLAQGEANTMSDRAILDSAGLGQRRATWRPESVFDDKVAP